MSSKDTFHRDLKRGVEVELMVLDSIRKKYPCALKIEGKFKGYDIWIPEVSKSIEVKCDQKSQHTGNLVVEVFMFGKPSGLMSTTADMWVFYDGIEFIYILTDKLKEMIIIEGLKLFSFVGKGDTEMKKAYLVKKEMVKRYSVNKKNETF